ncbi:MAG TPA: hypothetical protein VL442_05660 [Mucilaginibacter sp.]|jgi:hypothetical protein|nr:hypothetical protein [Mucilaginibacter sp.]
MALAILKSDGSAVKIDSFTNPVYDPNGFLIKFTTNNNTYKYYQVADFKSADRSRDDLEGYYVEEKYFLYMSGFVAADGVPNIVEMVVKYKFSFTNLAAKVGDSITISAVNYGAPYDYFYQEQVFTFNLESNADNASQVKNYKKAIIENTSTVGYQIDVPASATVVTNDVNLNTYPTGFFYDKNFGSNVGSWTISDAEKSKFKAVATLLAFKINSLLNDIFPSLLTASDMAIVDSIANTTSSDLSSLSDLGKAIFLIKKCWGYYYNPSGDPAYVNRVSFDTIFSTSPNYDEFNFYYLALSDFYANCYRRRENLLIMSDDDKLNYLLKVLPASALAIFPPSIIQKLLDQYIKNGDLSDSDQEIIVNIISSVTPANSDVYLDYLVAMSGGTKTNFEALYNLLSDARLERISVINWFVDEVSYRKYFVFAVYNLWKQSKYDATYFSPGTPGTGFNLGSYFALNPDKYVNKNVLTFQTNTFDPSDPNPFHADVNFTSSFSGDQIKINTVRTERTWVNTHRAGSVPLDSKVETPFGTFPMYQPIILIGYQANLEFAIPKKCSIPAFLFHYVEEYDRLADFDAGISLAINLTLDVLIAFFTGGIGTGVLAELAYLEEFTEIGAALKSSAASVEEIKIWAGLQQGASGLTTTFGALASVNQYLISTTNDQDEQALLLKNQQFILLALILTGAVENISSAKLTSIRIANMGNILGPKVTPSSGYPAGLVNSVAYVVGNTSEALSNIETSINSLPLADATKTILQGFTDAQKLAFWTSFSNLATESWQQLDSGNAVNNWLSLYNNEIAEASNFDFIINQSRVDAILRYYSDPGLKSALIALSYSNKIKFFDNFGNADDAFFSRLSEYPNVIEYWDGINADVQVYAAANPLTWLNQAIYNVRYLVKYVGKPMQEALTNDYILANYGSAGITLSEAVEGEVSQQLNSPLKLSEKQLVVGFIDKETGILSDLFTNFTVAEKGSGAVNNLVSGMQPNILERYQVAIEKFSSHSLITDVPFDIDRAGAVGSHAEFRSLNSLAMKKFGNNYVSPQDFDDWLKNNVLGYIRQIKPVKELGNAIKPTCIHCKYFTDLVTFMRID